MSTIKVGNISNVGGTKSSTTDDLADGRCRAWVNFAGNGTNGTNQTIRASFNVSSVYKNGTGDYTINFTSALPDANYCITGITSISGYYGADTALILGEALSASNTYSLKTASAIRVYTLNNDSNALVDAFSTNISIFR
jgi:hypothetical protein